MILTITISVILSTAISCRLIYNHIDKIERIIFEQLDNFEDDLMDGIRKTKDNEVGKWKRKYQ